MAIQFRDAQTTASGGSPRTVTRPTGTAEGDLLVLIVGGSNASQVVTPPASFVLVTGAEITGTTLNIAAYVKTAGATEPATYDVTYTGTGSITVGLMALYSDTAQTLIADGANTQANAAGPRICPAVTTTIANTMIVCAASLGATATTPPDGADERWDTGTLPRIWCCTRAFVGPGDTGTTTGTGVASANNTATVAIAEEEAALDTPTVLTATAASASQIDLAWQDTNDDETGFEVERSADGLTGWVEIDTTAADELSYSDTGLGAGETWWYRVRAFRN